MEKREIVRACQEDGTHTAQPGSPNANNPPGWEAPMHRAGFQARDPALTPILTLAFSYLPRH